MHPLLNKVNIYVLGMTNLTGTVDSALSGHCVKRTTVLSGQIFWSRQDVSLFQCKTLCVKRTSALCGQRTLFLIIWSGFFVLSGQRLDKLCVCTGGYKKYKKKRFNSLL